MQKNEQKYFITFISATQCRSEHSFNRNGKTRIERDSELRETCLVCLYILLPAWFVFFKKILRCKNIIIFLIDKKNNVCATVESHFMADII